MLSSVTSHAFSALGKAASLRLCPWRTVCLVLGDLGQTHVLFFQKLLVILLFLPSMCFFWCPFNTDHHINFLWARFIIVLTHPRKTHECCSPWIFPCLQMPACCIYHRSSGWLGVDAQRLCFRSELVGMTPLSSGINISPEKSEQWKCEVNIFPLSFFP